MSEGTSSSSWSNDGIVLGSYFSVSPPISPPKPMTKKPTKRKKRRKKMEKYFRVLPDNTCNHNYVAGEVGVVILEDGTNVRLRITESSCSNRVGFEGNWLLPENREQYNKVEKVSLKLTFESVVLPLELLNAVQETISQSKQDITEKIFIKWGLMEVLEKGKGMTMLFYGPPGTGKTLLAEVIAATLKKKLKMVDAGTIQTSECGGTERNIKRTFAEATKKDEVILFDECDSLIYDRSRVGMILGAEINCLLSEIERFEGVCIFTTNNTPCLDKAFERRVSLKLEFPFIH